MLRPCTLLWRPTCSRSTLVAPHMSCATTTHQLTHDTSCQPTCFAHALQTATHYTHWASVPRQSPHQPVHSSLGTPQTYSWPKPFPQAGATVAPHLATSTATHPLAPWGTPHAECPCTLAPGQHSRPGTTCAALLQHIKGSPTCPRATRHWRCVSSPFASSPAMRRRRESSRPWSTSRRPVASCSSHHSVEGPVPTLPSWQACSSPSRSVQAGIPPDHHPHAPPKFLQQAWQAWLGEPAVGAWGGQARMKKTGSGTVSWANRQKFVLLDSDRPARATG